jgi:hypothetical protein
MNFELIAVNLFEGVSTELFAARLLECVPVRLATLLLPGPTHLGCRCWLWEGQLNRNGYARTHWRELVVHRRLYEELVGPIPDRLLLDHLCRMRRCVNPLHMEPVTVRVNTLRGEAVLFQSKMSYDITESRDRV